MNTSQKAATQTPPTFSADTVADDITNNVSSIHEIMEQSLTQVLEQSKQLFATPNAQPEQIKEAALRLAQLVEASQLASQSLKNIQAGIQLENKIIEQAADESLPIPEWKTKADMWVADSVQYFDKGKQQLERSAQLFSQDKGFFGFVDKFLQHKDPSSPVPAQAFWDKVNVATFGIAVIASRVQNLPRVLGERLDQAIDKRVVAVSEVLEQWKHRSAAEYRELKVNLKEVTEGIKDDFSAMKSATVNAAEKTLVAGQVVSEMSDEFIATKLVDPVRNFIANAKARIQSWSASAYDLLNEQRSTFNTRYNTKLQERQNKDAAPEQNQTSQAPKL